MPDAAAPPPARRGRSRVRWSSVGDDPTGGWVAALLVVATILGTVGGPAIGRGVLHASDTLQMEAPWKAEAPHGFSPQNNATSDTVDATVPSRIEWSRRARAGDLPLWTDLQAGGAPLAALPNASAFSPLSIAWYLVPAWYAPAATKLLEMAVAALFTFLLARRLGAGRLAAGIAAVAFAGSGFQVVWTNWPHTHVAALVPALLWAVDRAHARGRPVDLVPIALVSASMWFEGFPAVTLWAHVAAGVFALVRATAPAPTEPGIRPRKLAAGARMAGQGRRLLVPLGGVVLGTMLAAVQLLPFAFRLGELDLAYREEKIGALPWRSIATMIVPDAFGNPAEKVFYGARNYVEINAFAGATVVVLAVAGLAMGASSRVPRWVRWFLALGIAVCIGLIFVGGPPLAAFQRVPIIGPNGIGRLRSLLAVLVALQAGVGVDALVRGDHPRRRVVALGVGLAVVGIGAALLLGSIAGTAEEVGRGGYFAQQLRLPAIVAALAVLLVLAAAVIRRTEARVVVAGALAVLVAVESVAFARAFLPTIDRELFYPVTPTHAFLAAELGDDRFAVDGFTLVPGSTVVYGLRAATAHTLTPAPYADLLTAVDPTAFDRSRTYPLFRPAPTLPASPVLDRMGVRYFVADPDSAVAGATEVVATATGQTELAAGDDLTAEVPAGEVRAVRLELRAPVAPTAATELVAELVAPDGSVLATGRRRVSRRTMAGPFDVALAPAPDPSATGPWTLRVRVETAGDGLALATSAGGGPAVTLVRPADDGLAVAFAEGSVVYARGGALPRFRWAGRALVEDDPAARVELLAGGGLAPDVVVLSAEPVGPGAAAAVTAAADALPPAGTPATLEVRDAGGDELHVEVDAPDAGWLVVADTIQDGWVAEVDGEPVALEDADHAFVAVAVPSGTHEVTLRYVPRGWRSGLALSAVAALVLVAAGIIGWRRRAR